MFPNLNISEWIGQLYLYAQPMFEACKPWLGLFIGVGLAGLFARGLIEFFQDRLDSLEGKEGLEEDMVGFSKNLSISKEKQVSTPKEKQVSAPWAERYHDYPYMHK